MSSDLHAERGHEKFREMCALAASGGLTADELAELKAHLEKCDVCRETLSQYRALRARRGLPALAGSYSEHHESPIVGRVRLPGRSCSPACARIKSPAGKPAEDATGSRPGWLRRIRTRWFKRARSEEAVSGSM